MAKRKQKPNMNQSGNPVTVIVARTLGLSGTPALILEWVVFLVLLFIVGGILLGGT